jgi:integrase
MSLSQNKFLKVDGWSSQYTSVDNLLLHLTRKTKSESSQKLYLWHLYKFCLFSQKKPNELVRLRRSEAEKIAQGYADTLYPNSPRYANMSIIVLKAFFAVNGFRRTKALELEGYHIPRRFRITPEYIPTKMEIYRMADSACSLRDRAIILALYSSGLRNSTLRAIRYLDIEEELTKGITYIRIPVYPEMKLIDPNACKGSVPYYTFMCDESAQALRLYLKDREAQNGGIKPEEILFCSEYNQIGKENRIKKTLTARELQIIVKMAAKRAGINDWMAVHPHALRKSFETTLHSQLIDGTNLDGKIQDFFIGHILPGSQDPYFDCTKVEWMRIQYSKLRFGRTVVENKFKVLEAAVARAFEDTDMDPKQILEEYVKLKSKAA